MKPRSTSSLFASVSRNPLGAYAAALLLAAGTSSTFAATLYWDGGASTVNNASDNATTTAQNWLSGGNWDNGTTSAPVTTWTAGDSAVFGGTAATQSVTAGTLTVGNITFGQGAAGAGTSGTGYTVSGGTLTLSGSTVTANTPATLNTVLAGTTGLAKAGASTLTLGGSNSYTGITAINTGTLKITPSGYIPYRYYRFSVLSNNGDGYNQLGELHYYNNGIWNAATGGSAAPNNGASGSEQYWGNLNDDKGANASGFTKFGVGGTPYSITYDMGSAKVINSYNWSTANDSTPARNPKRWIVAGSNDNSTWIPLDDRSNSDQAGPSALYTWAGSTTTYETATNAPNGGAANAYAIAGSGNIPNTSDVQIAAGATLDLNGTNQIVASLGNIGGGGGSVTNSSTTKSVTLTLNPASASTTFGGTIADSGAISAISLLKIGAGTQILTGNSTYSGTTTINTGVLQLGTGGNIGTGALSVIGGTFDLGGRSQTVQKLTGTSGSVTNSTASDSTLTVSLPASTAGDFSGALTTPSTGKLNLVINSTSGGTASSMSLSNTANTFKGTITVNGNESLTGVDANGLFGINTEGALGDPTNPIVLNNGGTLFNMYNPNPGGGWPSHALFTLGAERTITLGDIGGVIRICNGDLCTINSLITGSGALSKVDGGGVTLGGSISNNYTGGTILGGTGKLVLAKTGGALAIPGDVSLSSTGWAGNSSGLVLAANEQIADSAIITWTTTALGGTTQSASFLRTNGFTETVGGLDSSGNGGEAVIENRGYTDTAVYGTGTVIVNVTGTDSYSFNGVIRDVDGGSDGGNVAITKTGTGTQIFTGGGKGYTGATTVSGGVLQVDGTLPNTPVTVTGTGKLTGSGTLGSTVSVVSGGILAPGDVDGLGTLTTSGAVTIGSGGALFGPDVASALNGAVTIASGGKLHGVGTVNGNVTVQTGGELAPGVNGIGNVTAKAAVSLAGNATFEVNKTGGQITSDTLSGFTSISYGGTLTINYTGSAAVLGDIVQLFVPGTAATFSGSFSNIVGLPTLAAGLQWETTNLAGLGQIKVINSVSTPSFNPVGGGYVGAQSVTITSDSGSTIYYTTNGNEPTTSSPSGPSPITGITIPTNSNVTIKAFARKAGQTDSPKVTAIYNTVTTPKWNVDEGGLWTDPTRWLNSVSPNAVNASVDFTLPLTAPAFVSLDSGRTVGNLLFGTSEWTLDSIDNSVLTLATTSGSPTITTSGPVTISTILGGTQDLVKIGTGVLTLSGPNTYTGNTTVDQGVLAVTSFSGNGTESPLGKGNTLNLNGTTLRYSGGNSVNFGAFNRAVNLGTNGGTFDAAVSSSTYWFATGVISGTGPFAKTGAGQLIMQSTNTFDSPFQISQGEVQIRSAGALGSAVGATTVTDGARLCMAADITVNENLVLNGDGGGNGALQNNDNAASTITGNINLATNTSIGGGSPNVFTLSGVISGPGSLTKLQGNAVTLSGAASNTYTGLTILGGTGKLLLAKTGGAIAIPGNINLSSTAWNGNASGIVLGGDEQIADGSILTWTTTAQGGGEQQDSFLRLNGHTETVGGLMSIGNSIDPVVENRGLNDAATYGTGTLIIQTTGTSSYSYNGSIRNTDGGSNGGTVALVKTGSGTQILSGNMSNSGTTAVNAGTLQLDGSATFPVTVASGATLKGSGSTSGAVTVNAGAFLSPGGTIGTLTTGNTTIAGTYVFEGVASIADRLTVNGNLTITGSTLAITISSPLLEPSYVLASYTGTLTGTFGTVTGLPSGVTLQYDTANKQILLVTTQAGGYSTWATSKGLTGTNNGLTQDPDNDGASNLMEFYLNGNPLASDAATLVTQSLDATYLTLAFKRRDDANTDVATQAAQYGSNLTGWTDVVIGATSSAADANGVIVDVVANGTDPDTITVRIPRSLAASGKLFGRLKVTK